MALCRSSRPAARRHPARPPRRQVALAGRCTWPWPPAAARGFAGATAVAERDGTGWDGAGRGRAPAHKSEKGSSRAGVTRRFLRPGDPGRPADHALGARPPFAGNWPGGGCRIGQRLRRCCLPVWPAGWRRSARACEIAGHQGLVWRVSEHVWCAGSAGARTRRPQLLLAPSLNSWL